MNSTIDDIKQLPDLFKRKEHLEDQIKKLDEQKTALKNEIESEKTKADETLRTFDATIEAYKKASMEWWKQFYLENSAEIVQTSILSLLAKQTKDQKDLDESQKVASDEFIHKIDEAKTAFEDNKTLQQKFAQSAGTIAQKAMCYDVCIYIDRSKYTIKKFNDTRDWGLHLRPKGIDVSIFKYIFMLTNPFGYMDLDNAVRNLPSLYRKLLDSKKRLQEIIRQNNIRDINNPVGELNRRLNTAKETITKKNKEIETTKQQILDLQMLMALVGNGKVAFLKQWFCHHSFLNKQKEKYVADMSSSLSMLPDYPSMKLVYDELVQNVFDFKDADAYVEKDRKQIEASFTTTIVALMQKSRETDSQKEIACQALEDIRKGIKDLRDNYENILVEMTKNDPASTFFYQSQGWINATDAEGNSLAVKRIKEMASSRNKLEHLPVFEYLNLGGVEEPFLSEIDWQTGIDKAVNLVVKPLREDINKPDARLWAASNLITTILLSIPIRKVHFTFIDFKTNGIYAKIFNRLNRDKNIYTVVHDSIQLSEVKKLYLERTQNVEEITEVIVWTDCINDDSVRIKDELSGLLRNGAQYGYYTIAVPLDDQSVSERARLQAKQILVDYNFKEVYISGEDFNNGRGNFVSALETYVHAGADTSRATSIVQESMKNGSAFEQKPLLIGEEGIKVPIGYDENNHQEAFYEFNVNSDYPHTFLLGGSGSGKSFLLQNLLLNSMLKYRSSELEFYLMDFKMGAAEFRFYQDMPHVSHLLIDDADHQAVFEILNELNRKMAERGRKIGNEKNIAEYNEKHPDDRLPYIVLVVDECHKLFESDAADRKMQESINHVITSIVKEGRSQGVTFVFATQTFAGMEIPVEIKNEARNKYLMRVTTNEDAERLFNGGSMRNNSLSQGYSYHDATKTFVHIYDYRDYKEKSKETILKNNQRPLERNNFIFSGKDEFSLPVIGDQEKRYPSVYVGKSVNVNRDDIMIPLKIESGNILITGVNEELQAERVFFNAAFSLAKQTFANGKKVKLSIFDNPGDEDDRFDKREWLFEELALNDEVKIFRSKKERINEIMRLGNIAREGNNKNDVYVLLILAEERMKPLLRKELSQENLESSTELVMESPKKDIFGRPIGGNSTLSAPVRKSGTTVQDELLYLLKEGGNSHVHIIMQVNQPGNILEDSNMVYRNDIRQWFSDIIMLKCSQDVQMKLPGDNIRLDRLSDKSDMLRAIYLNEVGETRMFTPYVMPHRRSSF